METSSQSCLIHGDRPAIAAIGVCSYCATCQHEIAASVRGLAPGVVPRECFATASSGGGWRALSGSGAAHWLAHELGIRPAQGLTRCAAGFVVHRADLLFGRRELVRELPRPRDLWIDLAEESCGVVVASRRDEPNGIEISIRGLVGASAGAGVCDFYRDLHGRGRFFR